MTEQEYLTKRDNLFKTIANCSFASYNFFHSGMDELTYEAGLCVEIIMNKLCVHRQAEFPIYYKGIASSVKRRMDLVVEDSELGFVVCELKAVERVGDVHRHQLWSYMKLILCLFLFAMPISLKGQAVSKSVESYYSTNDNKTDTVCTVRYSICNNTRQKIVVMFTDDNVTSLPMQKILHRKCYKRYGDFCIAMFVGDNVQNWSKYINVPEFFIKFIEPEQHFDISVHMTNTDTS